MNPDEELNNKDNQEIIWNPPKLPNMDNETRRVLLFKQRKALGKLISDGSGARKMGFGFWRCCGKMSLQITAS